ncbi:MAG TPA: class I SAM-dependent methyltransferase [Anaerolineales bacterium]|nr:class I SAM-dependent methyltransferase [Anaerolineales bacterium]
MSDINAQIQAQFSRVAANYSASTVHAQGLELDRMLALAQLQGGETVLDAGTGAGHTALHFAPHVAQVIALDMTAAMLAQTEKLANARSIQNVRLMLGDVANIQLESASVDCVTSRYSAHHWANPEQAIREIRRVLKPNGRFLLFDVVALTDPTCDTFLQAIELMRDPSHVRDHTIQQWLELLTVGGFSAHLAGEYPLFLEFSAWVKRIATPPDNVALIRTLLEGAPAHVQQHFQLQTDLSFTLSTALISAKRNE